MASALSASLVASKTTLLPRPSLRGHFIACGWTRSGLQQSARAHGDLLCALEHMIGHSQVVGQMRLSGASASAQMDFYSEAIFDSLMHVADGMHLLSADLKDMCCTGSWLPGFQLRMPALCPGVHMRRMRRRCHISLVSLCISFDVMS